MEDELTMADELDDCRLEWPEVKYINSHALFVGYLSMAVKGVGFLVGLWTTVVLLGGFVSMLEKKDFWSLTIITLVQTAGVFDVFLNEKLRHAVKSLDGFLVTMGMVFKLLKEEEEKDDDESDIQSCRSLVGIIVTLIQALVFAIILGPLAVLYLSGLVISTSLSLWRLIQHDYGTGDGRANLTPALNVLYSLALFQGVLFFYQWVNHFAGKRFIRVVASRYGLGDEEGEAGHKLVKKYMKKAKIRCEKDPSFLEEWNLVMFAVELMKPESSSDHYVSGAMILDKILGQEKLEAQHALIRKLVGSASSGQVMKKLLRSLRSASEYNRTVRVLAARIVEKLADEISLASFPHALRCISSLLDTTIMEKQQQQHGDSASFEHYKELMVLGRSILHKLAAADEHNRRAIRGCSQSIISKAMLPVRKNLLHVHGNGHDAWKDIVAESLELMFQLVKDSGKTAGDKLLSQIFTNPEDAIRILGNIISCEQCQCNENLHVQAIRIREQKLPTEAPSTTTASNMGTEYSKTNIKVLVGIFLCKENKDASARKMAGETLAMQLSRNKSKANANAATIIFNASDTVVHDLKTVLLADKEETEYRICAAEILEHLHRTEEASYLKKLMEGMKDVLPQILNVIVPSPSKQGEKQAEKAEKGTDGTKTDPDIEEGVGAVASKDNGHVNDQKEDVDKKNLDTTRKDNGHVNDQKEDIDKKKLDRKRKLHAALLSLSAAIFEKLISDGKDLDQIDSTIVPGDFASSFAGKLKKMVEQNSEQTANCLRILKIACRMIISLLKLEGIYPKEELDSLMTSLSEASKNMSDLEAIMMLSSSDHTGKKTESIGSLVNEARGLMENKNKKYVAATPASTVSVPVPNLAQSFRH